MENIIVEFVSLKDHEDYEILTTYPYTIRRKDNHYVVNEFNDNGYISIYLNRKKIRKHIIIAKQFIENDDPINKIVVDHINRNTKDYHIENLRWTTISENSRNKSGQKNLKYKFVSNIPNNALTITEYEIYHKNSRTTYHFEDYYYYNNNFYWYNGIDYRILHINESKDGHKYVYLRDIESKSVCVQITKFKRMYDLE